MRTDSLNWWAWIIGIREEKEKGEGVSKDDMGMEGEERNYINLGVVTSVGRRSVTLSFEKPGRGPEMGASFDTSCDETSSQRT
jgi:hypothetical protein